MVKAKYSAAEIRQIVRSLVKTLDENNVAVEKIVLYGSYARGTVRPHSDIDVAVISPAFRGKKMMEIQALLARIVARYLSLVEVVGYSPEAYRTAEPETLIGEIRRTGKVLYAA
jgi:predicted nucleotidyltransferase